jgi:hypothetical protein
MSLEEIKSMSKDELAKVPRDEHGNIVLDEERCDNGFILKTVWNDIDYPGGKVVLLVSAIDEETVERFAAWCEKYLPDQCARGEHKAKTHHSQSKH